MIPPEAADPPVGDPTGYVVVEDDEIVYHPVPVTPSPAMANLFGAENPAEVVAKSTEVAGELTKIIQSQGLFKDIGGKKHVLVEGWTLLGSMLGVFPVVVWTRLVVHPGNGEIMGWEARVEARTLAGAVVGAAEAECLRSEKRWSSADDYAVRSMAQTRATSKALRGPLGFIVHLAGFAPTPEAEIPSDAPEVPKQRTPEQNKKFRAQLTELDQTKLLPDGFQSWTDWAKDWIGVNFSKTSTADLTVAEAHRFIDELDRQLAEAEDVPFG